MALSAEDKKEMQDLLAQSFAEGIALFRSKVEEENAKNPPQPADKPKEGSTGNDFTLAGFLLGDRPKLTS